MYIVLQLLKNLAKELRPVYLINIPRGHSSWHCQSAIFPACTTSWGMAANPVNIQYFVYRIRWIIYSFIIEIMGHCIKVSVKWCAIIYNTTVNLCTYLHVEKILIQFNLFKMSENYHENTGTYFMKTYYITTTYLWLPVIEVVPLTSLEDAGDHRAVLVVKRLQNQIILLLLADNISKLLFLKQQLQWKQLVKENTLGPLGIVSIFSVFVFYFNEIFVLCFSLVVLSVSIGVGISVCVWLASSTVNWISQQMLCHCLY